MLLGLWSRPAAWGWRRGTPRQLRPQAEAPPFLQTGWRTAARHLGPLVQVYVWGRRHQFVQMSFLGFFNFTAPYLPWVLLAFSVMLGGSPVMDLMGMGAGERGGTGRGGAGCGSAGCV